MIIQYTDKKEAIFQSTLELLQENGFHGTPMSQIARCANLSVGTIYHYFESKEALIMELFSYCKAKLTATLFEDLSDNNHSYEQEFKTIWKRFVQFYTLNPSYFRFMNQFYSSPFHEIERRRRENEPIDDEGNIQGFLKVGSQTNKLRNTNIQVLCSAFTGVAISMVRAIIFGKVSMDTAQIDEMADIVWKSIKAENI